MTATSVPRTDLHTDVHTDVPTLRFRSELNAADALLWNIESDPSLRTTIVAISLLDRSPNWRRLVERMTEACDLVPHLRQRVVSSLSPGQLHWEAADQFDMSYHLRRVAAPEPGDLRALLDLVAPMAMAPFDTARPLWEFTLVEGLAGGRAAFVQKVHHCFTDGVGGVRLAGLLLDETRGAKRTGRPTNTHLQADPPGTGSTSTAARTTRAMPGLVLRAITDPVGFVGASVRGVRSIGKLLAPARHPLSPVMNGRGLSRRLDAFDVPLDELLSAAHAAEGSLNDAFLAAVTGGMRLYHERHHATTDALRVTMPINLRRPEDPPGSNHFAPARFTLPISTVDPVARMHELGHLSRGWRHEPALAFTDVIAGVLDRMPVFVTTSIMGSMLKAIDFVATNVPGMKRRSYLAGAEVVRHYAFAPPSGSAFSVALLSHLDQCCVGINVDTTAVPDGEELTACIKAGFDEVLAVGRH